MMTLSVIKADVGSYVGHPSIHPAPIESAHHRAGGDIAAVSYTRWLALIAGRCVGKDDPVCIVRSQSNFPAVGEILDLFATPHIVGGWMRGSHHGPLMPVAEREATPSRFDGRPRVTALGLQFASGKLVGPRDMVDDQSFDDMERRYDVFLCHNSTDKPYVKDIGVRLVERGLRPWLDEWELPPGVPWQRELERQIRSIKSAAVFVGKAGIGPWQDLEQAAFLREFLRRGCPVIPVILPDCRKLPRLPVFLEGMTLVDFRKINPDPFERLIWGITGDRPLRLRRDTSEV